MTKLIKTFGYKPLDNFQIDKYCKKLFGRKYYKCLSVDSPIPKKDCYFVINTDRMSGSGIHWCSGIKKGKNVYLYDSYGRRANRILKIFVNKLKKKGYKVQNADVSDSDQRGNTSSSCGHRCISSLQIANDFGIKAFLML